MHLPKTTILNKNAETVADAIFKEWFCNLEFLPNYTQMEEKSLSISSQQKFWSS
jgi:hypothetical protein